MNLPDHIRLLCLDCDGVLTDGTLLIGDDGSESKRFHVHDGLAMKAWLASGRQLAVITARTSPALARRMEELGVSELHQGVSDKASVLRGILDQHSIDSRDCAYLGDDLADLPALSCCGFAMAPANARPEVCAVAHWVGERSGGDGAVREAIEMLLGASGDWESIVAGFTQLDSERA